MPGPTVVTPSNWNGLLVPIELGSPVRPKSARPIVLLPRQSKVAVNVLSLPVRSCVPAATLSRTDGAMRPQNAESLFSFLTSQ